MHIESNYDLRGLNTFGITARAKYFTEITEEASFTALIDSPQFQESEAVFLGGGSNILFTQDFDGIVILNKLGGIEIVQETERDVLIRAMGGEVWHDLVRFSVERGYWGLENLSLIPGSVGAAPMQNIGAYGAELGDVLESVEAFDVATGEKRIFTNAECALGYRDSVFKNSLKGKYFIVAVTIRLLKKSTANLSYKILADYVREHAVDALNPSALSDAVSEIRRSKLPDPKVIGNAGSFFKNIFVAPEKIAEMRKQYPDMPSFEEEGSIKIPAAWLIEHAGWKGYRRGNVGVHDKQALVLVNFGGGTGAEIKALADDIRASISEKFGLSLQTEVNFV